MLKGKYGSIAALSAVLSAVAVIGSVIAFARAADTITPSMGKLPAKAAMLNSTSNRYSKTESYTKVNNRLGLDGFAKIMEDSRLEVWHKEKNASIRVVDKATGYIWGGLAQDKPEDMNSTWSGIGNSLAAIDFFDGKGLEKRLSIADAAVGKKYTVEGNKLKYAISYTQLGIGFDFEMELKDGKLTFRMLDASIRETKEYSLGAVYFVPFLGSTRADELDGYIFVPDGPGALIRFNKPSQYLINFDKRVYGKDYGIDKLFEVNDLKSSRPNDFTTEEATVPMPVFGIVHGVKQNALFATIEKGAEYASIMATPSGMLTNYNWAAAKFIYRQKYLQPTSRSGAGVQIVQKKRNAYEAEITYDFLNGSSADYVGMAKLYRETLRNKGALPDKEIVDKEMPIQIDVIAADIEKGFLFNSLFEVTPPGQAKSIADRLSGAGIRNITMVLQGWQKGGVGGSKPSAFAFESKLGGKKAFFELDEYVKSMGGSFYYYENPVTVNNTQFDPRKEGGNSLSQALIKIERDNPDIWFKDTYYLESNIVADYVAKKAEQYAENGMKAMAINEFGSKLYAENQQDHVTTRTEARERFEKSAEVAASRLERLALYNPNQYLWKYASDIFNAPMMNSQYLFENDTVPFLQIVLKGSVNYFGPYTNLSFYTRPDMLKLVEYGAYPSFLVTGKNNSDLKFTTLSEVYSTYFEDWQQNIQEAYNYVSGGLSKVEGRRIADRTVLRQGVVKVDYEGRTSILVNYSGIEYNFDGTTVPAQDYVVLGGERQDER